MRERAHLDRRIDELSGDTACCGRVLLIEGPIGCGKTTAVRELAERAAGSGTTVLRATGSRTEREVPFGLARQLTSGAPPPVAGDRPADRIRLHEELVAQLPLVPGGRVFLGIDDVHLADQESLEFVLHLVRRLPPERTLLAVTSRPGTDQVTGRFLAELSGQLRLESLPLSLLGRDETRAMLTRRVGAQRAAELAGTAVALTAGSPLLLEPLIDDLALTGAPTAQRYGRAVVSCVHRGEQGPADVAGALTVLGDAPDVADVAAVTGLRPAAVRAAAQTLTAAGVLEGLRFRHEAARAAVRASLDEATLARLHLRAARTAHEAGLPAPVVVEHLLAAGETPAPAAGWAVELLTDAADRALLAEGTDRAARLLQVATGHCADPAARAAVSAHLARVLWRDRPIAALPQLLAAAGEPAALDGVAACEVVRQLLWHGRREQAAELLDRMRSRPGPQESAPAALETWLARCYPPLARGGGRADGRAPAVADPGTDLWLQATARLADALRGDRPDAAVDQAERVLRELGHASTGNWVEEAVLLAVEVLVRAGRAADAATWGEQLLGDSRTAVGTTGRARIAAVLGVTALERGDLASAARWSAEALRILPAPVWGVGVGIPLGVVLEALAGTGRYSEAEQWLVTTVPEGTLETLPGVRYRYGRGVYRLLTGHAIAALADFTACGELLEGWTADAGEVVPWRLGAARAWLQLGDSTEARRLVHDQLAQPSAQFGRVRGAALRQLAATGRPERRADLLTRALDLLERVGDVTEQAYVLADLIRAHRAVGEPRAARLVHRRALHVAEVAGLEPLVRELRDAVGDGAVVPEAATVTAVLTESERRVAGLAVRGYSNREIGARLYITPSTVEQHLTRVYRKLGVKRRRDLPPVLWVDVTQAG